MQNQGVVQTEAKLIEGKKQICLMLEDFLSPRINDGVLLIGIEEALLFLIVFVWWLDLIHECVFVPNMYI